MTGAGLAGALDALAFQIACGADEAIGNAPVDRFALPRDTPGRLPPRPAPAAAPRPAAPATALRPAADAAPAALRPAPAPDAAPDGIAGARALAAAARTLEGLREAMAGFEGCALRHGARSLVFADGNPAARVMVVGEAPGREEDRAGLPFVGRSGQLLDRMLAAIGLARTNPDPDRAVYITNVLPWRPPENREPSSDEIAMMKAFLLRHIELKDPDMLLLMGGSAARALLETAKGFTQIRGQWGEVLGRPALPTLHPAALLRRPADKRLAWADLLALSARLSGDRA